MSGLIQDAGPGWETALLLPVPAAERAVGRHRARLDEAARDGVPAHITVLYPFLPPAGIGGPLLATLRSLFAGFEAFQFTLDRVCWFGENVVWLGPRDPAPFSALTSLAFTAFPSCPPYGGQHAEVIPHLTIGHLGGQQALHAAAESVSPCLPVEATAAEVILMAGPRPGTPGTPPGLWRTIAAFPLGQRVSRAATRRAGKHPVAGVPAAGGLPADAMVSLRMGDGSEASLALRGVQARQVTAAVPGRKTRSARGQLQARVGGHARRHVPDFLLVHADNPVHVVNVKPAERLD